MDTWQKLVGNQATKLDISNLGHHNPGARAVGTPCTEIMKSDRISKSAISSTSFYHSYSYATTHSPYGPGFAEDASTLSNRPRTSLQKGNFEMGEMQKVARWQNLIPSFPWIAPPHPPPWRNPRKGRDQILQRSVAKP